MYKYVRLLLLCALTFSSATHARLIDTDNNDITCDLRKLSEEQVQDFLFNEDAAKFFGSQLRDVDAFQLLSHERPRGYASQPIETEKYTSLKNLHERVHPYKITITNNANYTISVAKNEYITTISDALVSFKKVIKLYPDFKAHATYSTIGAVISGLFGGFLILGGISMVAGGGRQNPQPAFRKRHDAWGRTVLEPQQQPASTASSGIGALFFGGLWCFGAWHLYKQAEKAKNFEKRKQSLAKTAPCLRRADGSKQRLRKGTMFSIAPGETYTEFVLVNHSSVSTSSSVFGAQRPSLEYYVGDDYPEEDESDDDITAELNNTEFDDEDEE